MHRRAAMMSQMATASCRTGACSVVTSSGSMRQNQGEDDPGVDH